MTIADYPSGEEDEKLVAYFYKFRHPEFRDGKWFVGMAGPYVADSDSARGGGKTFSIFKEFDSKPLSEHLKDYLERE